MSITFRYKYDVVVVGAGPAGSSAAIRLAQNGLNVVLIEQKQFPRAKLCGEFISPECLVLFSELGVLEKIRIAGAQPVNRTVYYARNGKSLAVPSEWFSHESHALALSRSQMDLQLLDRARSVGVHVLEETSATALSFDNKRVCGALVKNKVREIFEINATITLDATGRSRILARQVERTDETIERKRADFVAFKTHLKGANIPDGDCEIYAHRGGYGGCVRVESDHHNLCFIVSTDIAKKYTGDAAEILKKVVRKNERAEHSLRNAEIVDDWLAVPIERYGRASLAPVEGLLTIGDAAAFIDPFTGSGILLALESAKIAGNVITDGFTSNLSFSEIAREYQMQYSHAFDRRLRISSFVRHAAFVPFFAETLIKGLSLSRGLTRRIAQATRPA